MARSRPDLRGPPIELEGKLFFGVTRALGGQLGEESELLSPSSRSSPIYAIIPRFIVPMLELSIERRDFFLNIFSELM